MTEVKLQSDPKKYSRKKKSKGKTPVIGEEGDAVARPRAIGGYRGWRLATEVGGGRRREARPRRRELAGAAAEERREETVGGAARGAHES